MVDKKADNKGQYRLILDLRNVNKNLINIRFPLSNISEILDSLGGAKYFSHLDLSQGYYQVEIDEESRPCTAFTTPKGQFQLKRLAMGLKTSPSSFSRAMTLAMAGLTPESCFIYLDDIIVFGNSLENHNKNLIKVFERLRKVNLRLNPKKCQFLQKDVLFLGHRITPNGIHPDPEKTEVLRKYPTPTNGKEVKQFVAFANYYRKFIKNFAQIAEPLNKLSRKGVIFKWNENCQTAFETLRKALIQPPVLDFPDLSENNIFKLYTDASNFAIGSVLTNANGKPIAYASRVLNKGERNYSVIEKELLAIVWSVKHFRHFLLQRYFEIHSDHKPLMYLFNLRDPSSRLIKFRLTLEEYDFTVKYVKGQENSVADALSRIEITSEELKELHKVAENVFVMTRAQTKKVVETPSKKKEEIAHPGIVELLKKPGNKVNNSLECKIISDEEFDKLSNTKNGKVNYVKYNNILYTITKRRNHVRQQEILGNIENIENEDNLQRVDNTVDNCNRFALQNDITIFLCHRSLAKPVVLTSLEDMRHICVKYGIEEIYVIKSNIRTKENNKSNELIKSIVSQAVILKNANIKLSIIKQARVIEDEATKQMILNDFHLLATGGHAGVTRMYNSIRRHYFWSRMRIDIESYVLTCDKCQRFKHSKYNREPLTITTTATSAFEKIHLDIYGPLPVTDNDYKYILTLQCDLSKYVEAYCIENKEAQTVAKVFVEQFILRYGIPREVISDQGLEFLANIFQDTCKLLQIDKLQSTAYHHETLGAIENTHKNLGSFLRIQIATHGNDWASWIPYWVFAFNNTVHTETKYTPHELVFGKLSKIPTNITDSADPLYNFDNYPLELKYRLQTAWQDARTNLVLSKIKRKEVHDVKANSKDYAVNDKVLITKETGTKLEEVYSGPYTVLKVHDPNITLNINNKEVIVHKNRVKLYRKLDK